MKLFIRIKEGRPVEHPIFEDNFYQAFPDVDANNLPPEFARFVRVELPAIGVYEVYEGVTYEWANGVVKDVHHVRPMTFEEKTTKQAMTKANWAKNNLASWVFDEATCSFSAPVPYPTGQKIYRWDEPTVSWVEVSDA